MKISKYFKIETENGNEYYFTKTVNEKDKDKKYSTSELFKMAIDSADLPIQEIDFIENVEEISYDEYLENVK